MFYDRSSSRQSLSRATPKPGRRTGIGTMWFVKKCFQYEQLLLIIMWLQLNLRVFPFVYVLYTYVYRNATYYLIRKLNHLTLCCIDVLLSLKWHCGRVSDLLLIILTNKINIYLFTVEKIIIISIKKIIISGMYLNYKPSLEDWLKI